MNEIINGDIFTSPINFALEETMKRFENAEEDHEKLIYEALKRSKRLWENIRINGLEILGMTYEQFCDQCDKKRNIIFLSDDELDDFNKAVEIMDVMRN